MAPSLPVFGTDGIRGRAGTELSAEVALALGRSCAELLAGRSWVVGCDTRESSQTLTQAFAAGLASSGASVVDLGVAPTAAVAFASRRLDAMGAAVTASHNPFHDNGIKLFGAAGEKLAPGVERELEQSLHALLREYRPNPCDRPGRIVRDAAPLAAYIAWLAERAGAHDAGHLRIGLDLAHGAAVSAAVAAFEATGAELTVIGDAPDGRNINDGFGATATGALQEVVRSQGLDLGFAFDGDADRVIAIDETGRVVDGDFLMCVLARDRQATGALTGSSLVVTQWSNLGVHRSMTAAGITVHTSDVGDRAVAATMADTGTGLGGEQSGHIIMSDLLPVGDGLLTGIEVLEALLNQSLPFSELCDTVLTKLPQAADVVRVSRPPRDVVAQLADYAAEQNAQLGDTGRLVLRPSGTEEVVRVMAEAPEQSHAVLLVEEASAAIAAIA